MTVYTAKVFNKYTSMIIIPLQVVKKAINTIETLAIPFIAVFCSGSPRRETEHRRFIRFPTVWEMMGFTYKQVTTSVKPLNMLSMILNFQPTPVQFLISIYTNIRTGALRSTCKLPFQFRNCCRCVKCEPTSVNVILSVDEDEGKYVSRYWRIITS